jgi:single-strand DNA-binding protein
MMDMNEVFISGRLGRDPERIEAKNGRTRVEFPIANRRDYVASSGDKVESVTWLVIVSFDATADFCYEYLAKGAQVFVKGRLDIRRYPGRDGQEKQSIKIMAERVWFHSSWKGQHVDAAKDPNRLTEPSPRNQHKQDLI